MENDPIKAKPNANESKHTELSGDKVNMNQEGKQSKEQGKFFSEPQALTDRELQQIVLETQLGKKPVSFSEDELKNKVISPKQIQDVFNQNLSPGHVLNILKTMNVEDRVALFQDHMSEQRKSGQGSQKDPTKVIQQNIKTASNHIEKGMRGLKID